MILSPALTFPNHICDDTVKQHTEKPPVKPQNTDASSTIICHTRNPTLAHPPCFCLVFSPTYISLCLLLFGKWLLLSWVTGHNQAKHISLKARRATLMVRLGLERREEPKRSSHCVNVSPRECHSCPRPLLARPCPSSTHSAPPRTHPATSALSCSFISCNMVNIGRDIQRLAPVHRHPPDWVCLSLCHPSAYVSWHNMLFRLPTVPTLWFKTKYQFIPIMTKEYH